MPYREMLDRRLRPLPDRWLDVRLRLAHFALITYALPRARLARHIPAERFAIPEFVIDGVPCALISAVPFLDVDFHFIRFPWLKWRFAQTNYRAYVIDRVSGEHAVWFFGTTLGSPLVEIAKLLWKIPWHRARYALDCQHDQ